MTLGLVSMRRAPLHPGLHCDNTRTGYSDAQRREREAHLSPSRGPGDFQSTWYKLPLLQTSWSVSLLQNFPLALQHVSSSVNGMPLSPARSVLGKRNLLLICLLCQVLELPAQMVWDVTREGYGVPFLEEVTLFSQLPSAGHSERTHSELDTRGWDWGAHGSLLHKGKGGLAWEKREGASLVSSAG